MSGDPVMTSNDFAPMTSVVGFLLAPQERVASTLADWRDQINGPVRVQAFDGGLVENIGRLLPLTIGGASRELVVSTRDPRWTAILDCDFTGGTRSSATSVLARRLRTTGLVVVNIPDDEYQGARRWGARQLEIFGPGQTEFSNYVRTISVVNDGGRWRFDAAGTPQDFEKEDLYRARRVADRLSSETLADYCSSLGIEPFSDDFYQGPSILVSTHDGPLRSIELAEARRRLGIGNRATT